MTWQSAYLRRWGVHLLTLGMITACVQAQVVVSQVYGGGGNSGATYRNDYIEIFNTGTDAVPLNNWSVQYASSTGSSWQVTNLAGTLQPGQYYLIQESQGAGGTVNLPAADASGSLALSASAGKIALVNNTAALSGACPLASNIVDLVGYGTGTNCALGSVAPTLSNTTAALRGGSGCTNDGNNATDFSAGVPLPRNSSSPIHECSAGGITITPTTLPSAAVNAPYSIALTATGGTGPYVFTLAGALPAGFSLSATGLLTGTATTAADSPFTFTVTAADANFATASATYTLAITADVVCSPTATIAQVQGSGITSPLLGQTVTLSGIVTGSDRNGFFIQMPAPGDGDPATSDGIYIFSSGGTIPAIAQPGNSVCVSGPVGEFAPSSDPSSPTNTEINGATSVRLISTGNAVPEPAILTTSDTNPAGSIYQLERYEGMRVSVPLLQATAPTEGNIDEANATATSTGIFYGVLPGIERPFREPGVELPDPLPPGAPANVPRWDTNPEILGVDTSRLAAPLNVTTGAMVTDVTGALTYTNRAYRIVVEPTAGAAATANISATAVPLASSAELTISSFNLEHFYNTNGADPGTTHSSLTAAAFAKRLNKASLAIRTVLNTPDILAVEEVQNIQTLQALADKVNADATAASQNSPQYVPYLLPGNDISGINSGFLVKTPKVAVVSVTQYGKDTTFTNASGAQAILNDRPPLVLVAKALRPGSDTALPITVVVNHLRSLLDLNDPASGATVRAKREAQAEYLAKLIQGFQSADPTANIVSVGDYNAYQFNDGFVDSIGVIKGTPAHPDQVVLPGPTLVDPVLTDLVESDDIAPQNRYSYSFAGSAQVLDHIIVNQNMLKRLTGFAYARNNADFPETYRNDPNRPERVSDHDIPQARFQLPLDVSSRVRISGSGFFYSRVTHTYTGTIAITNTSDSPLTGPIYLALNNLPAGVTLAGSGNPLTVTTEALASGQTATIVIQLNDQSNVPISYAPTVFSGAL